MKFSEAFKGAFLKSADLGGRNLRLTIASIGLEQVGDERKVIMRFYEEDRGLVLNKTNGSVLQATFGEDMDGWIENVIILRPEMTDFQGKRVACIRVAVPANRTPSPVAKTGVENTADDMVV